MFIYNYKYINNILFKIINDIDNNINNNNNKINDINNTSINNPRTNNVSSGPNKININDKSFDEWLAGIIDGDGYFHLSKSGTTRLNITMDIKDKNVLHLIQSKYGGSIYKVSKANAMKYQLSSKKGLTKLINNINGEIRNPKRLLQLNNICLKYKINLLTPRPLTFNNGWYSGFMDSDGCIILNKDSGQIFLTTTQKDMYLLNIIRDMYGGKVVPSYGGIDAFKHIIYRKNEVINMIDNYFNNYPLRSRKMKRINLIKEFYTHRSYRVNFDNNVILYSVWILFKNKWDNYNDK